MTTLRNMLLLWAIVTLVLTSILLWIALQAPQPLTNAERIWFCQSDLHC